MKTITRRQSLQAWLAGAGAIGLRAMATGLPISVPRQSAVGAGRRRQAAAARST